MIIPLVNIDEKLIGLLNRMLPFYLWIGASAEIFYLDIGYDLENSTRKSYLLPPREWKMLPNNVRLSNPYSIGFINNINFYTIKNLQTHHTDVIYITLYSQRKTQDFAAFLESIGKDCNFYKEMITLTTGANPWTTPPQ